jgi:hypothetical protein
MGVRILRREQTMSIWSGRGRDAGTPIRYVFFVASLTALGGTAAAAAVSPSATIAGTVTLTAADGETFSGEGARVTLACAADGTTRTGVSDEHGAFRFLNVPVDRCSIEADVQGFVAPPVTVVTAANETACADLHLGIAPLRVGVTVGGTAPVRVPKILRRPCGSGAGRQLERSAKECSR